MTGTLVSCVPTRAMLESVECHTTSRATETATSSAIVFVLLISLGVFELKYMFARTQARGQTSVEPLLAETAGEDSALYNA